MVSSLKECGPLIAGPGPGNRDGGVRLVRTEVRDGHGTPGPFEPSGPLRRRATGRLPASEGPTGTGYAPLLGCARRRSGDQDSLTGRRPLSESTGRGIAPIATLERFVVYCSSELIISAAPPGAAQRARGIAQAVTLAYDDTTFFQVES